MQIVRLIITKPISAAEKTIRNALKEDWDVFKDTSKQFVRNNVVYCPQFIGLIA